MSYATSWIGKDLPAIHRDGVEYFLLSHGETLYLVPNQCPHRGGPLKFGFINDQNEIVCPMHRNAFAIARLIEQPLTIRLGEMPGAPA